MNGSQRNSILNIEIYSSLKIRKRKAKEPRLQKITFLKRYMGNDLKAFQVIPKTKKCKPTKNRGVVCEGLWDNIKAEISPYH